MNKTYEIARQHEAWIKKHMPNCIEAFIEDYGTSSYYKEIYEKIPESKRPTSKKPEIQEAQYEYNRVHGRIADVIKVLEKFEENNYEKLEKCLRLSNYGEMFCVRDYNPLERAKEAELFLKERGYI